MLLPGRLINPGDRENGRDNSCARLWQCFGYRGGDGIDR